MINLDQSIAKVKDEIGKTPKVEVTREFLIEVIMHEGAGRDRKTLLAWLNKQVEELPPPVVTGPPTATPGAPVKVEWSPPSDETFVESHSPYNRVYDPKPPIYRPERRGNVWCLYDVNNGRMRLETFENKGDASAFITRLEQDVDGLIKEQPYHYLGSE